MLGKDTVLFIADDKFVSAELLKKELDKNSGYLGIIIPYSKLEQKLKKRIEKPYGFYKTKIEKPVSEFLHKFIPKIKVTEEPVLYDVSSKKKLYNMMFRYAPSAVVVSDGAIRNSIEEGVKKLGMNIRLYVFSDGLGIDETLISDGVVHYFVDNIGARDKLIEKGVAAAAIDVNPLPVESGYFETEDIGTSKQKIGFEPTRRLCVVCLCGGAPFELPVSPAGGTEFVITGAGEGVTAESENLHISHTDSEITELDLFRAADTVATRYNPHTVKRVAALNKPLILICDGEEKIPEAEYLAAEGKALIVRNGAELNAALETVNDGDVYLASDETDPLSANKIATRMAGLIAEAKSGEGNS